MTKDPPSDERPDQRPDDRSDQRPDDRPGDWPGDWLRGVLAVCVLRVLADGPTYGYAIAVRLVSVGLGAVKGGTLYPLLLRMEQAGRVTVEWRAGEGGPGRKYYALTDAGRAELAMSAQRWARFARLTATFVTAPPAASAPPTKESAPTSTDASSTDEETS